MTVTIFGENKVMGISEKLENVDFNLVTFKTINKKNGYIVEQVRIENGKTHIVFSSGVYNTITVQDEETGRYLFKYNK